MEVLSSRILIRPRDPEVAWAFYGGTLGLAVAREFPGGVVYFLGTGYLEVSGRVPDAGSGPDGIWLQVRDVEAAEAELRTAGAVVTRGTRTEPWGLRECWIADPDGRALVLVEVPPDHPIRRDVR
ncbi:VOC family protein [Actinomycetospora sp. NBRC 106378]|uniref:VOC family protein n=1 Tax=Actinomycetospora sp. NBRC 106378 TaxID=3032208 RepID=UPI0024A25EEC|nr:VOC family protein [Actinomycetospora sp. NBRC 106378]GLZ51010.1 glyoxalase [Actinomycetospora sp. NBRC 106378]